ncbi:MAG: dicarboxylate/amino acid:cation symporter [Armatimonadetes bacterium]|nr:dicarboxylate/amino acid:cation symporter [Armatimonadota bacterium]
MTSARRKTPLHTRILIGLLLGAVSGLLAQALLPDGSKNAGLKRLNEDVMQHVGAAFLAMIFMIVVPLLFSALVLGVAEIGEVAKVGRIGVRALILTVVLSGIAVGIGLAGVNLVRPGEVIPSEKRQQLWNGINVEEASKKGAAEKSADVDPAVLGIVPKNPLLEASRALSGGLLPFMFFALVFGLALAGVPEERALPVRSFLEGVFAVCQRVVEMAMWFAPFGVFALVFRTASVLGLSALAAVGAYAALVIVCLAVHMFGTYSLVLKLIGKRNPLEFFRQVRSVIVTAFATSSSNATLPEALRCAQEDVGLPRDTSTFVLTVGATANQNGTALFEGITILFLAQFYGITLDFGQQVTVMGLAIVAGIGTAGVPGGSWPMIAGVIRRFAIPAESIGVVLGVDRILDMCRTTLNVVGDMTIAVCVDALEGGRTELPEVAEG